jgi:WD40 repeat protein
VDPEDPLVDNSLIPAAEYPHKSTIQCMWAVPGSIDIRSSTQDCLDGYQGSARYITGDKDGQVAIWRMVRPSNSPTLLRLVLVKVFNALNLKPAPLGASVRSVCMRDGMILLGLKSSEIMEVGESSLPAVFTKTRTGDTPYTGASRLPLSMPGTPGLPPPAPLVTSATGNAVLSAQRLIVGHSTGEVWGLSMHPFLPVFITSGDDCTLKCWNLSTQKLVSYIVLPDKCRAIDFEPIEGLSFSLALNSGAIWVLPSEILFGKKGGAFDINIDGIDVTSRIAVSSTGSPTISAPAVAAAAPADRSTPPLKPSASASSLVSPRVLSGPTQWVQMLKYSFEGSLLGAASHDHNLYLFDVADNYSLIKTVLTGHTSHVTHFDFGLLPRNSVVRKPDEARSLPNGAVETTAVVVTITEAYDAESRTVLPTQSTLTFVSVTEADGTVKAVDERVDITKLPARNVERADICLQSTSGAAELFFWMADGTRVQSASAMKDVWWATLSCPYGWPVQGIWPIEPDGTEINAVARSHSWEKVPVLATVDNFGRLRLYNYPCVTPGASDKCYRGHAMNVTRVMFSYDDAYCVTLGGGDKCVCVWATDIQDEIRERAAFSVAAVTSNESNTAPLDTVNEDDELAAVEMEPAEQDDGMSIFKLPPTAGDQSGAVKPWKAAVREPSHWAEPEEIGEEPDASLELKHVYGYRGWDCRNNIGFADSRFEIVYHVAGVGVVFNTKENKQLHNTEHDDDILCLDVHPEGHTVATGEIGKFPKIVLWDANTGVTIRVIQFHKRGVANVAFSANGELLVSTGMDDDRTVAVHNVRTGAVLGKGKAGRGVDIFTLSVGGNEVFVTGGKNHVKFWTLPQPNSPGGELSSKTGIYNLKAVKERTVVSSAFLGSDAVTGMKDGHILLWKDRTNTKFMKAHEGPVTAMYAISDSSPGIDTRELGPRVITGGKDGFVHIWDLQLRKKWSLNMNLTEPLSACPQIKAVATKENRLLIGTQASEIYEVSLLTNAEVYRHVQGHYDSRAEVWGVAAHPTLPQFVTCGDDMTVRLWNAKCLQQMEIVQVGAKVRAVAISPDGSQVAVATYEGKVLVLSANLKKQEASVTVSNSWTEVMQYSPDGKLLAVGTHDDTIYLLETRAYSCKFKCKGHHSFITGIDFSADSKVMQSVSGDYELLFWDCATGKQITSPTEVRDTKWATFTCKLGWPVQGIWPAEADGTDVNSVDRSPDGQYLVSGDDFSHVKLFRYPCVKEKSKFKAYKGHAEHVLKVRFSYDGKYVFSVGGLDKAVLQFEVKRDHGSKAKAKTHMLAI